jgi:hypothetical protein
MPMIATRWLDEDKTYRFKSYYFEEHAIFKKYDEEHIKKQLLPRGAITYHNQKDKTVDGQILCDLAEKLVTEICDKRTTFSDFKILKNTNFNKRLSAGLLILKYKDYPFVIKIFRETPESFTNPFNKGWESDFLFIMGCGINRYFSGLTRVKNLEIIRNLIAEDPYWACRVVLPRKWFWIPQNVRWFELTGYNIGPVSCRSIKLPSVYAIIADAIEVEQTFTMEQPDQVELAIKLGHYLGNRLDPHINNFVIEKETGKIVIIDTEHFAAIMGLKRALAFSSYFSWYFQLSMKCVKDVFGRSKSYRHRLQTNPVPEWLAV